MTKKTINYEPLREWQRITGNRGEYMAEIAGVNPSTLSRWMSAGKAVPGEVILAWQTAFRWSVAETAHFCLNGPAPVDERLFVTPNEFKRLQALNAFAEALK